jgi:hypothetical protein
MIEILLQAERALSLGLLDRAETLYRQVAEADPRNSIAVVGLARVALERGDDDDSLVLGRRALVIDPQNSAAQRLVQRLEEVRTYREAAKAATEDASSDPAVGTSPAPPERRPDATPAEIAPGEGEAAAAHDPAAPGGMPEPRLAPRPEAGRGTVSDVAPPSATDAAPAPAPGPDAPTGAEPGAEPEQKPRRSRWRRWLDRLFRRV